MKSIARTSRTSIAIGSAIVPAWTMFLTMLTITAVPFCAPHRAGDDTGVHYVWRDRGLVLRDAPGTGGKPLAKVAYADTVRTHSHDSVGRPVRLDGIKGRYLNVEVNGRSGFLFDAFLGRIAPPVTCESFANYLNEIDRTVELVERRTSTGTTLYANGITVIDEESPRHASITIVIDDFPLHLGFRLAQICNPHFFAGRVFPRESSRRSRAGDFVSSVDHARFHASGRAVQFENRTETTEHIEKTTVQPMPAGGVRIKYYYSALDT